MVRDIKFYIENHLNFQLSIMESYKLAAENEDPLYNTQNTFTCGNIMVNRKTQNK